MVALFLAPGPYLADPSERRRCRDIQATPTSTVSLGSVVVRRRVLLTLRLVGTLVDDRVHGKVVSWGDVWGMGRAESMSSRHQYLTFEGSL